MNFKTYREIENWKTYLVEKGYTLVEWDDFNETFAYVAKMIIFCCFLTVVIAKGCDLHQMDLSNVFLHAKLKEELYMQALEGYKVS